MFANNTTLVSVPTHEAQKDQSIFDVLTLIGGCRSLGISEQSAARYNLIIFADVPAELRKYRSRYSNLKNVYYYPLGEGHTAASLFANASPELQRCLARRAPLNAEDGMGSLPGIGYQAIKTKLETIEHARFLQHIVDLAVIATGGSPGRIRGRTAFSGGGGTGSAAPVLLSRSFINALSVLEIPIDWDYEYVGSVTFTGVAKRAALNAASTQWRILRDLVRERPANLPLLVESLRIVEFPPFGHDLEGRGREIGLDEQSASAHEVRLYFNMIKPNSAMDGPFGSASSWTMDRTDCLSLTEDVAPYVAPVLLTQVRNAIRDSSAVPSRIAEIVAETQERPLARESIESLIAMPGDVDLCVTEVQRPAKSQQHALLAVGADGHEFDLSRVDADFQQTPHTLTEYTHSLLDLSSIKAAVESEITGVRDKMEALNDEIATLKIDLTKLLPKWWRSRPGWGSRHQRLEEQCLSVARDLRESSDELRDQQDLLNALNAASGMIGREADFRRSKLKQIADCLDHFVPRGALRADRPAPVAVKAVDAVFPQLMRLPELEKPHQLHLLAEMVAAVTIEGLAKLLGEPTARLEAIAGAIVKGKFPIKGPPHGAKVQRREGLQVLVLPPLPDSFRQSLINLIAKENDKLIVAVGDSAAAGVAVIRYTVFSSDSLRELFPGRMWADLRRASESDLRDLYFPDGMDGLAEDLAQN